MPIWKIKKILGIKIILRLIIASESYLCPRSIPVLSPDHWIVDAVSTRQYSGCEAVCTQDCREDSGAQVLCMYDLEIAWRATTHGTE